MRAGSVTLLVVLAVSLAHSASAQRSGDDCIASIQGVVAQTSLPIGEIAEALGCRQLSDGRWVTATVGGTLPYRHYVEPDPALEAVIADTRPRVRADLRRMFEDSRLSHVFVYDMVGNSVRYQGAGGRTETISIAGSNLATTPEWIDFGTLRQQYEEAALAYLLTPGNESLASYVGWVGQRRDTAILAISENVPLVMRDTIALHYGYKTIPWSWQLADPFTIDAYIIWLAQTDGAFPKPAGQSENCCTYRDEKAFPLLVYIVDAFGTLLPGACVQISNGTSTQDVCDNDPNDLDQRIGVLRADVVSGVYTIHEVKPPTGHEPLTEGQVAPVSEGGGIAALTYEEEDEDEDKGGAIA